MSSYASHGQENDPISWSKDDFESLVDSEEPVSSVIRLPRAILTSSVTTPGPSDAPPPLPPKPPFVAVTASAASSGQGGAPPPLPPKPAFARATVKPTGAPPPLPPKPESARVEKLPDGTGKGQLTHPSSLGIPLENGEHGEPLPHFASQIPPPTRPLPPVPRQDRKPSYGEEGSWVPSLLDDRSLFDPPFPPEPTILSDGDPMRSPLGRDGMDTSTQSLSDHVPNLSLPLPPPPFASHRHRISSAFQSMTSTDAKDGIAALGNVSLSVEAAEDSQIGAIVLSRARLKSLPNVSHVRPAPIEWRLYKSQNPGGEAWSVLQEYLTNVSLKTRGRNRALQLLTGYVVGACLESTDAGLNLLTEIVRRMRGAERSERDGSIFTLLVNIGAHVSFVQRFSWSSVEEVTRKVFSEVVEQMHGRQDDDVMWERALRCYLMLLRSSDEQPSDDISSKCLAALALHTGDLAHTDVDHVLISEGLCPRIQNGREDFPSSAKIDVKCLEEIGGIDTILTLYARTASPSARQSLFAVIYDITVLQCLEEVGQEDMAILKDHIVTFRALLETHEIAQLLTHTFRVGPWKEFVTDTIRAMLFHPLSGDALDNVMGKSPSERAGQKAFQERSESQPMGEARVSGNRDPEYRSASSKYIASTRALVKLLDKQFCLKVIRQMERMALQHSGVLARRETMHYAREWKILSDIETHLQRFLFSRNRDSPCTLADILTKVYVAVVDITSGWSNLKSILCMAEIVIEFLTMKPPFTRHPKGPAALVDSVPQMFLKGQLSVSRSLLLQANPSIFTLLLLASQSKVPVRRVSECRQCLVEFLGTTGNPAELLKTFADDDDPVVAYRASEIVSRYADVSLQPSTPGSVTQEDR